MARKHLELELLSLQFPHYSPAIRKRVSCIVVTHGCEDTSDEVIDGLWATCRNDIAALLSTSGTSRHPIEEQNSSEISREEREFIRTYIDEARSYEAELSDREDDDFEALYRSIMDPIVAAKRARRAQAALENDRWAFFNKPDADADFDRWRNRLLLPAQAVALSFGKDPDVVTPESLKPYKRVARSPFREEFGDRLGHLEAAISAGELHVPLSVQTFERWAMSKGFGLPEQLAGKAAVLIDEGPEYWKVKFEIVQAQLENLRLGVDEMGSQTKGSMYQLILGMAIARFEHRTDQRSDATTAILNALADVGLTLKRDAIHKHLTDAATILDFEYKEVIRWSAKFIKKN